MKYKLLSLLAFLFFITSYFCAVPHLPLNSGGTNTICFFNHDQNLPWPLTIAEDRQQLIRHGPHCLHMVHELSSNESNNEVDQMHLEHCVTFLSKVIRFFDDNKDYAVSNLVCQDMTDIQMVKPGFDYYAYVNYRYVIMEAEVNEAFKRLAEMSSNQWHYFGLINGYYLGKILMKEWKNETLTSYERTYLDGWYHDRVVRLGALGLYCEHKEKVLEVLNNAVRMDCRSCCQWCGGRCLQSCGYGCGCGCCY